MNHPVVHFRLGHLPFGLGLVIGLHAATAATQPVTTAAHHDEVIALRTRVSAQLDCKSFPSDPPLPDASELALAKRVDALVEGALEDSGLRLTVPSSTSQDDAKPRPCNSEPELLALAKQSWVVSPYLIPKEGRYVLRLVVVAPNSHVLQVSTQEVEEQELDVRVIVMVAELLAASPRITSPNTTTAKVAPTGVSPPSTDAPRSTGRAILTLSSAVLGGAVGYSLQRAGGSDDPRLTYPLIALGTGIGLGASMIVADEWDINVGEATYLTAGMLWPVTSGLLLARAYQVSPSTDRYAYGLGGAFAGITLATFATRMTDVNEGAAAIAHSGGVTGLLLGGLVDMTLSGSTEHVPWHGMGFGSGIGVLVGGVAATQLNLSSSRVAFIDMAAGLGGLASAAATSFLLLGEGDLVTVNRQRLWLGTIGVSTLVGGTIGWYLTRNWTQQEHMGSGLASFFPYATVTPSIAPQGTPSGTDITAGVQGVF